MHYRLAMPLEPGMDDTLAWRSESLAVNFQFDEMLAAIIH